MTTCRSKKFQLSSITDSGATILEFALISPILLVLLLGIFEFARIIMIRNTIANAAYKAAAVGAVAPDLDAEGPDGELARGREINAVRLAGRRFAELVLVGEPESGSLARLVNYDQTQSAEHLAGTAMLLPSNVLHSDPVEVIVPKPGVGETLTDTLRRLPVVVRIHSRIESIFPFIAPLDFVSTVAFMKEPKTFMSEPLALNCDGTPVRAGQTVTCTCQDNLHIWDSSVGTCVCPGDVIGEACDECPEGYRLVAPGSNQCVCDRTAANCCVEDPTLCENGQSPVVDVVHCRCMGSGGCTDPGWFLTPDGKKCTCALCGPGQVLRLHPDCHCANCPVGQTSYDGITCECDERNCNPATEYYDFTTCSCKTCPPEQVPDGKYACKCPNQRFVDEDSGHCVCSGYMNDLYVTPARDQCIAQQQTLNSYKCECDPCASGYFNTTTNACGCPADAIAACTSQDPPLYASTSNCQCYACRLNYVPNAAGTGCVCGNGFTSANCKDAEGNWIARWNSNNCSCDACPAPKIPWGSTCSCPSELSAECAESGGTFNTADCSCNPACPPPRELDADGACICDTEQLQRDCNIQGKRYDSTNCVCIACPAGQVLSQWGNCACDPTPSVVGQPGGPADCGANQYFSSSSCSCLACPDGQVKTPNGTSCTACDVSTLSASCQPNQTMNLSSCTCQNCPNGLVANAARTSCICDPATSPKCVAGQFLNSSCTCSVCSYRNQVLDPLLNTCVCPASIAQNCTGANQVYGSFNCECETCRGLATPNESKTFCTCPIIDDECNGKFNAYYCTCTACTGYGVPNSAKTACTCPAEAASNCAATQKLDTSSCTCVDCTASKCTGAKQVYNPSTCLCDTCSNQKEADGDHLNCVCNKTVATANCAENQTFNSSTCACETCSYLKKRSSSNQCECTYTTTTNPCDEDQTFDAASCRCLDCPTDWINDSSNNCVCDVDTVRERCNVKQFVDLAACSCAACPGNTIQTAEGTACACEKCPGGMGLHDLEDCECQVCPGLDEWPEGFSFQNGQCADNRCYPNCTDIDGDGLLTGAKAER